MRRLLVVIPLLLALAPGCSPEIGYARRDGGTPGDDGGPIGPACDGADSDGDGIADAWDGPGADEDSDGDGVPDRDEAGADPCTPPDSDGDGTPDFLDTDSDNDGLDDGRERALGTDPRQIDTDGDGVTDLGEAEGTGTDPTDPTSTIDPTDFFVVLPYGGDHVERPLRFDTNIAVADVFFLVDMTGSMQEERSNLIRGLLDTIIPGIQAAIPDVQFGAGGLDDFPYNSYGGTRDLPFYLLREIAPPEQDVGAWSLSASPTVCPSGGSNDIGQITGSPNGVADILEAVQGLPCHAGADVPESYGPALWATATGMGLTWPSGSIPGRSCPAIPDETGTRRGYPCFRPGALPIVLLFGDAAWHNDYMDSTTYSFTAPRYSETVAALNDLGARVLPIWSQLSGRDDYEAVARDTGTVDGSGNPLVFDINPDGSGLTGAVVDAVSQLVGGTPQDVSTRTENVDGNPDGFDATRFILSITPLEGYREGIAGTGYASKDDTTFYGVVPGTVVEFTVDFHNDVRPPADRAQIFRARIVVVGNRVADLDSREVYIVVPPEGAIVLI